MTNSPASKTTSAFYIQSVIAFAVALAVVVIGEINLPVASWTRAFLALGTVFLVSATFSLAKCVRDQQETDTVVNRIDRARIERMLADYDPYRVPAQPQGFQGTTDFQGTHGPHGVPHAGEAQPAPTFQPYPAQSPVHA